MVYKNNYFFLVLLLSFILILPFQLTAAPIDDITNDLINVASDAKINTETTTGDITGRIITVILSFLGAIFLVLMIYGGVTWMTAAGNEEKVKKASSLMTSAAVGLLIILSAWLITNYIIFKQIAASF